MQPKGIVVTIRGGGELLLNKRHFGTGVSGARPPEHPSAPRQRPRLAHGFCHAPSAARHPRWSAPAQDIARCRAAWTRAAGGGRGRAFWGRFFSKVVTVPMFLASLMPMLLW